VAAERRRRRRRRERDPESSPVEPSRAFASASRGEAGDLRYGSKWTVQMHPIGTAAEP